MKRLLPILSSVFILAACSSNPTETETKTLQSVNEANAIDTAGLAQFQQWKAQNELTVAEVPQQAQEPAAAEPVKTVTVIRERVIERPAPVRSQPKPKPQPTPEPVVNDPLPTNSGGGEVAQNTGGSTEGAEPATAPEAAKKEGWSKAAKGAAIGGAGGAVLGAIISKKNRAAGAAIGGVLGGAVGYGIGKKKDNKDAGN